MKSKRLLLMLLMALLVPWAAQAQETLTVHDGTGTNRYVPFYGYYADEAQTNQMIYPAAELGDMDGGTISGMTFYWTPGQYSGGSGVGTWTISIGETTATSLSGLDNTTAFTVVFTGGLDALFNSTDHILPIAFDSPYIYNGGNLIVQFSHQTVTSYKDYAFYGETVQGASYCYSSQRNFLPKTTFTYEAAASDCPKPNNFVASNVTAHTADLSWESDGFEFVLEYKKASDSNWTQKWPDVNSYTLTGLAAETEYQARVAAFHETCPTDPETGDHTQSDWREISFTTGIACPAPTNLDVTDGSITAHEATVTWEGSSDSYVVSLGVYDYTAQPTTETLIEEGFEDAESFGDWTPISGNVTRKSGYPHTGSYYLDFRGTTSNMIALPKLNVPTNTLNVEFWTRPESTGGSSGKFAIGYMTDIADASTFVAVETYNSTEMTTTYVQKTVDFSNAPENAYIAFRQFDCATYYYWFVDDVVINGPVYPINWTEYTTNAQTYTFENLTPNTPYQVKVKGNCGDDGYSQETAPISFTTLESCVTPTDLAVSNITGHEATITWTSAADAWQICVNDDEENLIDVTVATYTFSGLAPETDYTVKVRTNCGNEYSDWTNNVTFTTDVACPAPTNLVVTDGSITAREATVTWEGTSESYVVMIGEENLAASANFETGDLSQANFTTTTSYPFTVVENTHSGAYCAKSGNGGEDSTTSDMVLEVTLSDDATLSFSAKVSSEGGYDKAYFSIDGTNKINDISGNGNWIDYSYPLTAGTHTLRWYFTKDSSTSSYDDCFYVDDIVISAGVDSWNEYTSNVQTYTFSNLTPNRHYQVKVKGNCGDDGYSQESAPVGFTTLPSCIAPTGLAMVAGYPTAHEVSFTWDYEEGEVFQFALVPGNVTDPSEVNFNTTWYAGDNFPMWNTLSADTDWSFFLRKNCDGDFSDPVYVYFHTLVACPAPTGFAVMPNSITGHTADLTWQGSSNVYYVTYGAMNTTCTVLSTGFEDNTIPATMTNSTTYPWTVTAGGANESGYCAIPGNAGVNSSSSDLTFVVTGPGTVSFMAKVSSESGYDYGRFLIDGSQKVNISGTQDWTAYEFELTAGTHTLIWRYYKDSSTASGNDLFYVDDINVTGLTVGEWQTVEATEVPFTLENLLPETPYQVTMYGDCGDDGYSQATAPVSFTTEIACHVPTNLTVIESTITTESAELTWEPGTDSPSQDTWQIAISDEEGFDPDELIDLINVRESPTYVLNNLTQNTTYYIYVRALCGTEDYSEWSAMSSFTTLPSCQAPEDLRVDYLSQTSATVRWSGNADNYILTLGQAALGVTFEDNNILALFNNNSSYPWTIEEMNGSYCMRSGNAGVHNSASSISISVYYDVDGTLEFDAECRGEGTSTYWDHCDFYIDDERQLYVGANVSGWNHYSYEIPAGEHTFTWSYTKDGSTHPTGDYFAVDNIMSNIVWRTPSTGSSTEYFYYNLDEGTYYVVKAQGICGNDHSPVSEISFTTPLYTYTKSITGYGENTTGGYYLVASPITKVTPTANNGFLTNEYDLYSFDQTFYALEWRNFKSDAFDLVSGQGYLYANSQDVNLTFTGRIYRGNGEISLTRDENTAHPDMQGFNLVGNPYNTRATVNKDFYKMNDTRDGFIAVNHDNAIIEVMDGIFVYAAEDGETITFHEYVPSYAPQPSAGLTMNVTGNQRGNTIDRAIVRFGQSSMMPKFQLNENSTKVYIPMDGKDYAVVSTGNVGELPVNFKAESNGTYTLSFTAQEVSFSYLHLIDNLTGADVNLLNTPSYTFDARTTDYASRFRLVFATGSSTSSDTFGFVNAAGNLCIFGIEGEATLQVVDVLGHVISSNQFSGSYEQKLNVAPGVYMLRLINGNDVKVQKMVIK